ncbi:hypothetical protein WN55_03511 [Dufourea novaeangliae]|uniref:Uncharacterized protein n=1 Tax=Dufourea novaeangliae TaxID=178035 RepID=A0A154PJH1_DUFNO|nr:hypothetical protein WN55_03511 [Dufourea novaeangliae]
MPNFTSSICDPSADAYSDLWWQMGRDFGLINTFRATVKKAVRSQTIFMSFFKS